jgi:hypothetical protein
MMSFHKILRILEHPAMAGQSAVVGTNLSEKGREKRERNGGTVGADDVVQVHYQYKFYVKPAKGFII